MIGGIDPFCPGTFGEQTDDVPPVDVCDLLAHRGCIWFFKPALQKQSSLVHRKG